VHSLWGVGGIIAVGGGNAFHGGRAFVTIVVVNIHHGRGDQEEKERHKDETYHVEYNVDQQHTSSASVHSHKDCEME